MPRLFLLILAAALLPAIAAAGEPIPNKLVVLTFDDSVKSHFTVVRPILKKYEFGATFFITEGFDFPTNKNDYMTWQQIAQLHKDGFEIGNHTRDHVGVKADNLDKVTEQLEAINARCQEHGIPRTTSFAYPGNASDVGGFPILKKLGIQFARRGGAPEFPYKEGNGFAYEPGLDHPLLIPSAGDARPDWELDDFIRAVEQAKHGRIAVLQFHGVPDNAHPWVHTPREKFESYMKYLAINGYQVIAMRDLVKYVNPAAVPLDPLGVIEDRQQSRKTKTSRDNFREPHDKNDLRRWLKNMVVYHQFSEAEIGAATGLTVEKIRAAIEEFDIDRKQRPARGENDPLVVLPYPGGRHPRVGFRDGAIRPQRETKISVFLPWADSGYVVVDVPEAIWSAQPAGRELLYLAHTHVPTMWSKQGIELEPLEWKPTPDGSLDVTRRLPNGVSFGAIVHPEKDAVRMELWIKNVSKMPLSGLRVQNCVMLKDAVGFGLPTTSNRVMSDPYVACRNEEGDRWIITAWENCVRPWGNEHCPCMHSDPQFPDCGVGETKRLRGWLSFHEGKDVELEFERIEATGWRKGQVK